MRIKKNDRTVGRCEKNGPSDAGEGQKSRKTLVTKKPTVSVSTYPFDATSRVAELYRRSPFLGSLSLEFRRWTPCSFRPAYRPPTIGTGKRKTVETSRTEFRDSVTRVVNIYDIIIMYLWLNMLFYWCYNNRQFTTNRDRLSSVNWWQRDMIKIVYDIYYWYCCCCCCCCW